MLDTQRSIILRKGEEICEICDTKRRVSQSSDRVSIFGILQEDICHARGGFVVVTLQTLALGLGFKLQFRVDAMPGVTKAPTAESLGSPPKTLCAVAVSGRPEYTSR